MSGVVGHIAWASNKAADGLDYAFSGRVIIPAALGGVGGWLMGIGPKLGAFQGLVSGAMHSWVVRPVTGVIERNSGSEANQFHPNTVTWFRVAGTVVEIAVPLMVTAYYGEQVLTAVGSTLPEAVQWLVIPSDASYTFIRGALVGVAPAVVQHAIGALREEKKKLN